MVPVFKPLIEQEEIESEQEHPREQTHQSKSTPAQPFEPRRWSGKFIDQIDPFGQLARLDDDHRDIVGPAAQIGQID